jgi:hypothetical protein
MRGPVIICPINPTRRERSDEHFDAGRSESHGTNALMNFLTEAMAAKGRVGMWRGGGRPGISVSAAAQHPAPVTLHDPIHFDETPKISGDAVISIVAA